MDTQVRVLGVPMDLGADRRGVDMGPSAIRYGGLADQLASAGIDCIDGGDIAVPRPEESDPDAGGLPSGRAKFFRETKEVCEDVATAVDATLMDGQFPLVLGGDHSIGIGTIAGAARNNEDLGVIWFDAHGDFNTPETTPSGNIHGMSLAAVLGDGAFADHDWAHTPAVREENVVLVGLRDVDDGERRRLYESDVTAFTMSDIDTRGAPEVVAEALEIATDGTDGIHVSLDLDWLDPTEAPGVGTPVRGGVSYREAHIAMEYVAEYHDQLRSMEMVEVNPILDEHNRTAELGCELVASAFGKRVL
ncbi:MULTISPECIES: arginase [Haloarcula]|uniref:Arginase n=1 Tax=Haloarcula hispanica TaxID=51589 RepID=A0A5J5LJ16_HALHI|nr:MULTISPECIES: arginase [Haloarcula]KAA9409500.1 arginase [Haloarcula hispanica]KZX47890.1 arginase [Haloarcula sp. K1]MUV49463.1 arginase [Haloarcula sp. CBA1122]